ncbi:hypothetical protein BZA70DRAFT_197533 [Myxozyma melibiosi]|uniref:Cell wall mannoprotein PIR1-like C-terminal domain-containing protein n=1 Tax=Myxozyma melibiosi TaxID=54550 RepID=A0ABR1F2C6_9ASCO
MYTRSVLLAASASLAALAAADSCLPTSAFSLTTSEGGLSQIYDGQVRTGLSLGQIYDGQVRTGNDTSCLTLVASSNGTLSDITGRPCYVTPYHQFECTAALQDNATPYGFCVESGLLTYEGNSTFYACDTGVDDQANIYVEEISAPACTAINLIVGSENCGTCTASTVVSTVVSTVAATVTETTAETVTVSGAGETVTVTGAGETVTVAETETSEVTVTAVGSTVVTPSTVYATVTATATATVTKTEYDTAITTAIAATTVVEESTVVAPTTVVEESTVVAPTTVVEESTVVAPTTVVEESTVVAPTTLRPPSSRSPPSLPLPQSSRSRLLLLLPLPPRL